MRGDYTGGEGRGLGHAQCNTPRGPDEFRPTMEQYTMIFRRSDAPLTHVMLAEIRRLFIINGVLAKGQAENIPQFAQQRLGFSHILVLGRFEDGLGDLLQDGDRGRRIEIVVQRCEEAPPVRFEIE